MKNPLVLLALLLLTFATAHADPIGGIISYQGKLTNTDHTPVADGVYSVTFTFYESGNNTGVTQTLPVRTFSGVFSTFLSIGALSFNPANSYDLGVSLNGTETRFPIASVPVAQVARSATTVVDSSITTGKVADGAVTAAKIAPGAMTDTQLHDGAVTATKIANGSVAGDKVAAATITGDKIAPGAITDAHISGVAAAKIGGLLQGGQIADGAVTDAKIVGVGAAKITGTLTAAQIPNIDTSKITGTLGTSQIAAGAITNAQIQGVDGGKITGVIGVGQIPNLDAAKITGTLGVNQIPNLDASKISGTLSAGQIPNVDASKITGTINNGQIADGAVTQDTAPTLLRAFSPTGNKLLVQSGTMVGTPAANGVFTISFPAAFPTNLVTVIASLGNNDGATSVTAIGSLGSFQALVLAGQAPYTNPVRVNWIAIGY